MGRGGGNDVRTKQQTYHCNAEEQRCGKVCCWTLPALVGGLGWGWSVCSTRRREKKFFPTAEESGVMKIEEDAREISLRRSVGGAF